jgi:hypothetical protein
LLPPKSTDSLRDFGDGNKSKTIANRDQKIRRIASGTMLKLSVVTEGDHPKPFNFASTEVRCWRFRSLACI